MCVKPLKDYFPYCVGEHYACHLHLWWPEVSLQESAPSSHRVSPGGSTLGDQAWWKEPFDGAIPLAWP